MQPEEVLELMRSAPERYDTVRAALRYRGDGPAIERLPEYGNERFVYAPREGLGVG